MWQLIRNKTDLTLMMAMLVGANGAVFAQAVACPAPPNQVMPTVTMQMTYDATSGLYTYTYSVTNGASSAQAIDSFSIDFASGMTNATSPTGWYGGVLYTNQTYGWDAVAVSNPDAVVDGGTAPQSSVQIQPGQTLAGFSLQSMKGPGPVKYYIRGYAPIPQQPSEQAAETLAEQCPLAVGKMLDVALVGTTTGAVNAIPVQISIKPMAQAPVPINPTDKGVTPVAILGSSTFNVNSVNVATLNFGTGQASPADKGSISDVNKDGIPDLVVQFPNQEIGARCNDTALFLTGSTTDGTAIQGSEAIQTVGCQTTTSGGATK